MTFMPTEIDVDPADRDLWRKTRQQGLGSSDAAALLGMDRFSSPWSVYVDKTEPLGEDEQTPALEWGHRLEDAIAEKFADDHPEFHSYKPRIMFAHPEFPYMISNPDRLLFRPYALTKPDGSPSDNLWYRGDAPDAINEVKTSRLDEDWSGEFPPDRTLIQCQHQMAVHGLDTVYVSALLHGRDYAEYVVPRDQAAIDLLYEVEAEFWQRVLERRPPAEVDGSAATSDAIKRLYAEPVAESFVEIGDVGAELLRRRSLLKTHVKDGEEQLAVVENELKLMFGNATQATVQGDVAATWNVVGASRLDGKRLADERPDVAAEYRKSSSYRRLDVKKDWR